MLAIVLTRKDFREFDQIISLYTKDHGKREALARGVKKITSKNSGSLEPFSLVEIEIVPGKEIDHITTVQPLQLFRDIRSSLKKMIMARVVVELTDELIKGSAEDAGLFNVLVEFFTFINNTPKPNSFLVTAFILRLLDHLGFKPELTRCIKNGEVVATSNAAYYFSIESGGVVCGKCHDSYLAKKQQLISLSYREVSTFSKIMNSSSSTIQDITSSRDEDKKINELLCEFIVFYCGYKMKNWWDASRVE